MLQEEMLKAWTMERWTRSTIRFYCSNKNINCTERGSLVNVTNRFPNQNENKKKLFSEFQF